MMIDLKPMPTPRPKVNRKFGSVYSPAAYKKYVAMVKETMKKHLASIGVNTPTECALKMTLIFNIPRPENTSLVGPDGDWDNYAKAICDAGNLLVWHDDVQIQEAHTYKQWNDSPSSKPNGYISLCVQALDPTDSKPYRAAWRKPGTKKTKSKISLIPAKKSPKTSSKNSQPKKAGKSTKKR
jgi:Holliday junction resolvase RusA-like endonuclease